VPALFVAAVFFATGLFRGATSTTFDEPFYLVATLRAYLVGSFESFARFGVGPLPALVAYAPAAFAARAGEVAPEAVPGLIDLARRANALLIGAPLAIAVYAWMARRRGFGAGCVAGALIAASPTFLAHASVATTDAGFALFALLALWAIDRLGRDSSRRAEALAAGALGLALASKPTAFFLLAVLFAALVLRERPRASGLADAVLGAAARTAAIGAAAFLLAWTFYGFAFAPGGVPAPIAAIAFQVERARGPGHEAFLLGARTSHGWWYYFPLAFLLKSTPVDVAAALVAAARLLRASAWRDGTVRLWALAAGAYGALMLANPIDLGQRYLLVLYPILVLAAVDAACAFPRRRLLAALALAGQIASAASAAPDYLAYFTPAVGGSAQGYRYLVDSNLDWGQGLPALRAALERVGARRVALSYFGTADPRAYGIDAAPWPAADPRCDWLAVSATHLEGIDAPGDPFAALRAIAPHERAGASIFLYRLDDPAVRAALAAAPK
jgi:4-amino-4-deoxy-L-arabinose transferase-like glycosyltransferase